MEQRNMYLDRLVDVVQLGQHVPHVGEGTELGLLVLGNLRDCWKQKLLLKPSRRIIDSLENYQTFAEDCKNVKHRVYDGGLLAFRVKFGHPVQSSDIYLSS